MQQEKLEFLLKNGADPNSSNYDNTTPLIIACKNRQLDAIRLLIKYGANIDHQDNNGDTPLIALCESIQSIEQCELIEYLIKNGSKPNAKTKSGNTALSNCVNGNHSVELEQIQKLIQCLIVHGARVYADDKNT